MKLRIGVIFGGKSVEHEISIVTALQAMDNFDKEKYEIIPIYITKDGTFYSGGMLKYVDSFKDFNLIRKYAKKVNLINKNGRFVLETAGFIKREYNEIHIAFPIVHGSGTEDGTIQGYLQTLGIPCIGNNIYSSVVGQDKVFMKQILENNDIPITDYIWFFDTDYFNDKESLFKKIDKLSYPLIIKPATLGSSIGIEVIKRKEELESAIERVIKYDHKIMIEEKIDEVIEYNCAVLVNKEVIMASDIEEIDNNEDFREYKDKFIKEDEEDYPIKRIFPAKISNNLSSEIEKLAINVFKLLNNSGTSRIDFLYDSKKKKIYVNEINTIPNCFSHHLWENKNISYRELLEVLINDALYKIARQEELETSIDNDIIPNLTTKKLKEMK